MSINSNRFFVCLCAIWYKFLIRIVWKLFQIRFNDYCFARDLGAPMSTRYRVRPFFLLLLLLFRVRVNLSHATNQIEVKLSIKITAMTCKELFYFIDKLFFFEVLTYEYELNKKKQKIQTSNVSTNITATKKEKINLNEEQNRKKKKVEIKWWMCSHRECFWAFASHQT